MDLNWILEDAVRVTPYGPATTDGCLVQDAGYTKAVILRADESGTEILANGDLYEGSGQSTLLDLIDSAIELGTGEHYFGNDDDPKDNDGYPHWPDPEPEAPGAVLETASVVASRAFRGVLGAGIDLKTLGMVLDDLKYALMTGDVAENMSPAPPIHRETWRRAGVDFSEVD